MNKKLIITAVTSLFFAIIFGVSGIMIAIGTQPTINRNRITESRTFEEFSKLSMDANGDLEIRKGDKNELAITDDSDTIENIKTEIRDNTLFITDENDSKITLFNFDFNEDPRFILTVKELSSVQFKGSSTITIGDVSTESFAIDVEGSGDIAIKSITSKDITFNRYGSSTITIDNVKTEKMSVKTQGHGDVTLGAFDGKSLSVDMVGSGQFAASGKVDEFNLIKEGVGDSNTQFLIASKVKIKASGSGSIAVSALETLDIDKDGRGDVIYFGKPRITKTGDGYFGEFDYGGDISDER
jgi:hypothetical protein